VKEKQLVVNSMVASKDHRPYVTIALGEEAAQLDPADARRYGLWLIEAAESAEVDAFMVKYLQQQGFDLPQVQKMLLQIRAARPKDQGNK
jgi:hypothetical protein